VTAPAITALIDTYNHERFIEEAIVSVLEQDFPAADVEILVVDDGSTDRTPDIIRKFAPSVRMIRKSNGGQASAFNAGIPEAHGRIIAFLDGDDSWAPDKLSRVAEHFEAHPEIGVVGHGFFQMDTSEGKTIQILPPVQGPISFTTAPGAAQFRQMMCFFGTSRLAIRKAVAMRAIPVPESILIEADEFLCILAIARSSATILPEPLTYYRLHEDNLYHFRSPDAAKLTRKHDSIAALAHELAPRLAAAAVGPERIRVLLGPLQNQARRLRLKLDGGMPWETLAAERAERNFSYGERSLAYRVFECVCLGLTLVMTPRCYYRLRDWYSASTLRRWRERLGEPVLASRIENIPAPEIPAKGSSIRPARSV
jgi:glycosyltransferase involved in cell wall biosynthesis